MTGNEIKQKIKSFCKEYKLAEVSCQSLRAVIEKQGYTIVEYNQIFNDENTAKLIESLNLSDAISHTKGFTYATGSYRIVFVHEDLSEDEKRIVLAHEAGHIYLNHLSNAPIIGRDVREEYEANEFAHFLLNPSGNIKLASAVKKHKKAVIACLITVLLVAGGVVALSVINTEKQYYGEYYVTSTGNKYHEKDCIFVKNKDNVRRLTKEEFDSGDYKPCDMCLPK